jgi:bifunctional enzyme CysN/CysC
MGLSRQVDARRRGYGGRLNNAPLVLDSEAGALLPTTHEASLTPEDMEGYVRAHQRRTPFPFETSGAELIPHARRRTENIHWQAVDVTKAGRAGLNAQKPCVLWFTGLSGAGKSTIANLVEKRLHSAGKHTYLLDGDNVRHGLNKDLGFTDPDRVENIRRVAEVARLMVDAGLIVLVSFISPFRSERRMARHLVAEGEFFEVYVDTPLAEAEKRDPKGLYKMARRGELKHFTGIDSPYEAPEHAEIRLDTVTLSPHEAADLIVARLAAAGIVTEGC